MPNSSGARLKRNHRAALLAGMAGFVLGVFLPPAAAQVGLDITGPNGAGALERQLAAISDLDVPLWLQVNDLQGSLRRGEVERARGVLAEFKRRGHRLCLEVRFAGRSHFAPRRSGVAFAPPADLAAVFAECRELNRQFGDLVDAWEIENEPELHFFSGPTSEYAAVLKAAYLGFAAGDPPANSAPGKRPLVLMAPMGLPPGPVFDRLAANGLFSYTDGFNFHFYGYAPDFPDTYRRWEEAAARAAAPGWRGWIRRLATRLRLRPQTSRPVFITEYGHGMLTSAAATTPEGRTAQEQWYEEMLGYLRTERPAAAMAFRLAPTREGSIEFGLAHGPARAGSPALAKLLTAAEGSAWTPRNWTFPAMPPPASVVLDLIPLAEWRVDKDGDGYALAAGQETGRYHVRVYNFGAQPVTGSLSLRLSDDSGSPALSARPLVVAPLQSVEVEVEAAPGQRPGRLAVQFTDASTHRRAQLITTLKRDGIDTAVSWDAARLLRETGPAHRAALLQRQAVAGEPLPQPGPDAWLTTPGTTVETLADRWLFTVRSMPGEGARRAVAELPLPDDFTVATGSTLGFAHAAGSNALFNVQLRTANGNLFGSTRQFATQAAGGHEVVALDYFNLQFYGRARRPATLRRAQPVSLVFQFRPSVLPATYEVRQLQFMSPVPLSPARSTLRWTEGKTPSATGL